MFASPVSPVVSRRRRRGTGFALLMGGLSLLGLSALLAGCGGGAKDDLVIAKVGDREITKGYYEDKLAKYEQNELPRDPAGRPIDTSTPEGKEEFLEIIISKELMALKAQDMGYGKEEHIVEADRALSEYHAGTALHKDLIEAPANSVSDEELADYYANLHKRRNCSFLICNFRDDALKARQKLIDGALWEDVAEEFHDGANPSGNFRVDIPWGRFEDSFENAVYSLKEGEISQPVETIYGWWLLRLENEDSVKVAPLETIRDQVLNSIRMRKINLSRKNFMDESRRKHDYMLDETSLWIVFQGLPEGEIMIDPETKKPTPREELKPLDVPLQDMDRLFYQVRLNDQLQKTTIGDYKIAFDKANVFERPKRSDMLGGLRQKILQGIDKQLIVQEARERGYFNDPRVTDEAGEKVEEMMVSMLHEKAIPYDTKITPEQLDEFWNEHQGEYVIPEGRSGEIVFCADEESARAAEAAAKEGKAWSEILDLYGTDEANRERQGLTDIVRAHVDHPIKDALFSLKATGDVSAPFPVSEKWAVTRLLAVEPAIQKTLDEVRDEVGDRMRRIRKDAALQQMLAEWRAEYGVQVFKDRLQKVRSWEELSAQQATTEVS
jgi:peptidyl-prolyl cis-trans isomerase C